MPQKSKEVDDIIQELLQLQIRQSFLYHRLAEINDEDETEDTPDTHRSQAPRHGHRAPQLWRNGDHVRITNRVRVGTKPVTENDRLARITDINEEEQHDDTRVAIESVNGKPTWRLRKNLRWLRPGDYE